MEKVSKQFRSQLTGELQEFELTKKQHIQDIDSGNYYIHSYWVSATGDVEVLEFMCAVPKGYKDLDFKTLNVDCIVGSEKINEEALVA